jgi:enamine deaminase RidA (YjgF/YER057c/UK114 family)
VTERRLISSGSSFEELIGYSRAVVDGDWLHVSGTTGFDYASMTISDDVVEQAEQVVANLGAALEEAGFSFADIVRVRYLLPDRADFEPCWPVLRRAFGDARPAATMMECGLIDPRVRIEIEVTARRRA